MKRLLPAALATAMLVIGSADRGRAAPKRPDGHSSSDRWRARVQFPPKGQRYSMGNLPLDRPDRYPGYSGGDSHGRHSGADHRGHPHHRWSHLPFNRAYRTDCWYDLYGFGYDPYAWGFSYSRPYYGAYYYYRAAPLFVPAEAIFGPEANRRFLGWDRMHPPALDPIVEAPDEVDDGWEDLPKRMKLNLRAAKQEALAWRFIGFGDHHFAKGKYADAHSRYRKAAQACASVAEAYSRQGYSLAALGRYEAAVKALKRALAIDPGWPGADFSNNELYGPNEAAKAAHMEALAKAALEQPHEADLLFLLGVYVHFDGQPGRAGTFFRRAAELAGHDDAHINAFLNQLKPQEM